MQPLQGILNLDKPAGMTSTRAVGLVKRLLPRGTKIGHAGTLDSFATGVLLLLVGRATKWCERLMDAPKQYEATIRLGFTTHTDDPEGNPQPWTRADGQPAVAPEIDQLGVALQSFVGTISQRPPVYSALKLGGRRASDLARSGVSVAPEARHVRVYGIRMTAYAWPDLQMVVDCGRGTYIRSIARDLGEKLDTGGHLVSLRRTAIGPFTAANALSLDSLRSLTPPLLPQTMLSDLPELPLLV